MTHYVRRAGTKCIPSVNIIELTKFSLKCYLKSEGAVTYAEHAKGK